MRRRLGRLILTAALSGVLAGCVFVRRHQVVFVEPSWKYTEEPASASVRLAQSDEQRLSSNSIATGREEAAGISD